MQRGRVRSPVRAVQGRVRASRKNGCRPCPSEDVGLQLVIFIVTLCSLVVVCSARTMEGDGENAFEDTGEGIDFDNLVSPASFPLLLPSSLLVYCSFPSSTPRPGNRNG